MTKQELQLEVEHLKFIIASITPALGPADDEILDMAEREWQSLLLGVKNSGRFYSNGPVLEESN